MKSSYEVPTIPNRPLKSLIEVETFGDIALRRNIKNAFIENAEFDPDLIHYDADYQNSQALSASFQMHMEGVRDILKARYPQGCRVVEVGCGKGDFVELLQADGSFEVSGYDGAYEGDNSAIQKRFLNASDKIDTDLVVLRHVLEHIQRPHDFLKLLSNIFHAADVYIEVPDFDWIEMNQAFFDITYEHVNYFTNESLSQLFRSIEQHGPLFGGQYQYVIAKLSQSDYAQFSIAYDTADNWTGLDFDSLFPSFQTAIVQLERAVNDSSIYIWGAATKGVMFCHHLKRMHPRIFERIRAAVDINPMKANRYMPSSRLPILHVDTFFEQAGDGDLVLIMNPNYEQEIVAELALRGPASIRHIGI